MTLVREHTFNSAWWGEPCGIVADLRLFERPIDEIRAALAPFAWVELRADDSVLPARSTLVNAGFFHADTQIHFRLDLGKLTATPSTEQLSVRFADRRSPPFVVDTRGMASFRHERFRHLPGADDERIRARYAAWIEQLVSEHPATCAEVLAGPDDDPKSVQGWFLSRPHSNGLELTLAMLRDRARISGHHLYHRACLAFARRGHRIGWASFSVNNTAVLNVYASLGARFTRSEHFWLWVRDDARA